MKETTRRYPQLMFPVQEQNELAVLFHEAIEAQKVWSETPPDVKSEEKRHA